MMTQRIMEICSEVQDYLNESYNFFGKKFCKLITRNKDGSGGSVLCFITADGDVYKPASWKAPAKHVRFRLLDDKSYEEALRRAEFSGGWLYMR